MSAQFLIDFEPGSRSISARQFHAPRGRAEAFAGVHNLEGIG